MLSASTFIAQMPASVVDQKAAHDLRGNSEKVSAALPIDGTLLHKLHISLMDEGRRLQWGSLSFPPHVTAGQPSQFAIDDRDQLVRSLGLAFRQVGEERGHVDRCQIPNSTVAIHLFVAPLFFAFRSIQS